MSMSTNILFFKDMAASEQDLLDIKKMCDAKGISYPKEVSDFILSQDDIHPNRSLVGLKDKDNANMIKYCCERWKHDMQDGYEVDLKKLPKEITLIRFYNGW